MFNGNVAVYNALLIILTKYLTILLKLFYFIRTGRDGWIKIQLKKKKLFFPHETTHIFGLEC